MFSFSHLTLSFCFLSLSLSRLLFFTTRLTSFELHRTWGQQLMVTSSDCQSTVIVLIAQSSLWHGYLFVDTLTHSLTHSPTHTPTHTLLLHSTHLFILHSFHLMASAMGFWSFYTTLHENVLCFPDRRVVVATPPMPHTPASAVAPSGNM